LDNLRVKEVIVRSLTDPAAKPTAAIPLIKEFHSAPGFDTSYKWAIGNALETVADKSVVDDLLEIASNPRYGAAREMIVCALGKLKDPRILDVLIALLGDEGVRGHAITALGNWAAQGRGHIYNLF